MEDVKETKKIAQVMITCSYKGQGIEFTKEEVSNNIDQHLSMYISLKF